MRQKRQESQVHITEYSAYFLIKQTIFSFYCHLSTSKKQKQTNKQTTAAEATKTTKTIR